MTIGGPSMGIIHEHVDRDNRPGKGRPPAWRLKIYTVEGPLSFVLADIIEHAKAWPELSLSALLLRLERVKSIDVEGLLVMRNLMTHMETLGIPVVLCGANADVASRLAEAGLHRFHDRVSYCDDISVLL
jgi:MFS superfamily sulfate permease-like transporter